MVQISGFSKILKQSYVLIWIFAEKLAGVEIKEMPEVIQSEMGQKQKLQRVLDMINRILQLPPNWHNTKWSVDSRDFVGN